MDQDEFETKRPRLPVKLIIVAAIFFLIVLTAIWAGILLMVWHFGVSRIKED